jgi:imidazoleglycerol-phosphate dehydratase
LGQSDVGVQQVASHGLFDLEVDAAGDTNLEYRTNEDVALALGTALAKALGERKGICRFGDCTVPMEEALVQVVLVCLSLLPRFGVNYVDKGV